MLAESLNRQTQLSDLHDKESQSIFQRLPPNTKTGRDYIDLSFNKNRIYSKYEFLERLLATLNFQPEYIDSLAFLASTIIFKLPEDDYLIFTKNPEGNTVLNIIDTGLVLERESRPPIKIGITAEVKIKPQQ